MQSNFASLEAFAAEIERTEKAAQDYVATNAAISMTDAQTLFLEDKDFAMSDLAHSQLATKLGIPKAYYDKIGEIGGMREYNVNMLLQQKPNDRKMLRVLDEQVRAVLSDKYKRVDNGPVLRSIFPVIQEAVQSGEAAMRSYSLSNTKMYLQVAFPKVQGEIKRGDVVQGGVTFTNSEVGMGQFEIQAWVERLVCTNGMILPSVLKQRHVGHGISDTDLDGMIFRAETVEAEQKAIGMASHDILYNMLKGEWFHEQLQKMKDSAEDAIVRPATTIEKTVKLLGLPEATQDPLLNNLATGGEINRWGLVNSLTAMAKMFPDPDKQAEYEAHGATILNLNRKDWERLSA